jgi:acyl dehydratase
MIDLDIPALRARVGQEIAVSDWLEITQQRIDQFAEATGDHQWIHVDPARAATELPGGRTIAHGFLTLSLVSLMLRSTFRIAVRMAINYGSNKVRFITPVPSGSRVRARFTPIAVDDVSNAVQVTWGITIELEHGSKPAAAVEWIVRYYP